MKTSMRMLLAVSAPALLALAACQTAPDSGSGSYVLNQEQEAALRAASDSLGVPRPPREEACATLTEHLATLDTTAANFAGLSQAVARVCELLPPRPPKLDSAARAALCDSLTVAAAGADTTDPAFAALLHHRQQACGELPPPPRGPKPPRPDSLHADSTRPDSLRPPKPPRPDSTHMDSTSHRPPPPKGKRPHK